MPGAPDAGASLDGGIVDDGGGAADPSDAVHRPARFALRCTRPARTGTRRARGSTAGSSFRASAPRSSPTYPPDQRTPIPTNPPFVINFGERLRATFHVVIGDRPCTSPRSRPAGAGDRPGHRRHARRLLRLRSRPRPRGSAVPVADWGTAIGARSPSRSTALALGGDAVGRQRDPGGRRERQTTGASPSCRWPRPASACARASSARRGGSPGAS